LSELTSLSDQLKAGLSGAAHQPDKEEGPTVSEIAEKIKSLKAAHSIEATPQRARQKHFSAEEPVTARIRRRQEGNPMAGEAVQAYRDMGAGAVLSPAVADNSSINPQMTFQERIAMERRRTEPEPSLS